MKNYITIFLFISACACHGESFKSNETAALTGLGSAVRSYVREENRLPTSWREMIDAGYIGQDLLKNAESSLDFQNRFGFLGDKRIFQAVYPPKKIVAMSVSCGMEGNRTNSNGVTEEGRWLIVETQKSGIQTLWHSESQLSLIFDRAGLDLNDYTGTEGKWVNKEELISVRAHKVAQESRALKSQDYELPTSEAERRLKKERDLLKSTGNTTNTTLWVGLTVFLLIICVWIICRKFKFHQ